MAGDRARFCTKCARTVHDLSAMTERDARALVAGSAERRCVRFAVRPDGTVVTGGGGRWLGSALGALGVALAALVFWASVALLQRPWRALARRLAASTSPAPLPAQPSKDDEERRRAYDEVMKRLADSSRELMNRERGASHGSVWMMGEAPSVPRGWLGLTVDPPKRAKKSRR